MDYFLRWEQWQESPGNGSWDRTNTSTMREQFFNQMVRVKDSQGLAEFEDDQQFSYYEHINKALARPDQYSQGIFDKEADNYLKVNQALSLDVWLWTHACTMS